MKLKMSDFIEEKSLEKAFLPEGLLRLIKSSRYFWTLAVISDGQKGQIWYGWQQNKKQFVGKTQASRE